MCLKYRYPNYMFGCELTTLVRQLCHHHTASTINHWVMEAALKREHFNVQDVDSAANVIPQQLCTHTRARMRMRTNTQTLDEVTGYSTLAIQVADLRVTSTKMGYKISHWPHTQNVNRVGERTDSFKIILLLKSACHDNSALLIIKSPKYRGPDFSVDFFIFISHCKPCQQSEKQKEYRKLAVVMFLLSGFHSLVVVWAANLLFDLLRGPIVCSL